jgi:hypothetical protein
MLALDAAKTAVKTSGKSGVKHELGKQRRRSPDDPHGCQGSTHQGSNSQQHYD